MALILINALENRLSDYPTFRSTIIITSCSPMFRILIIFFCCLFYDTVSIWTKEFWMVGWWMGKVLEGRDQGQVWHYLGIYLAGQENHKKPVMIACVPAKIQTEYLPPEYMSRVLLFHQPIKSKVIIPTLITLTVFKLVSEMRTIYILYFCILSSPRYCQKLPVSFIFTNT